MKPSERIDQLWAAMNIGVGRSSAIVAYLDEQAADRPCPPDEAASWYHPAPAPSPWEDKPPTLAVQLSQAKLDAIEAQTMQRAAERQRDEARALLEDWELFGATITGCTNHSGRVALDDAKAQMDTHLRVMTSLVDIQRERAEKAEGEITRLKAESARLREDDAAQRKLAAVLGMENIPDTGPTWPASWEALISRVSQLAEENARLSGELTETQTLLLAATNQLTEARTDLTWERGWDLLRKAQMGAVVEAARVVARLDDTDLHDPNLRMEALAAALSVLDAPSQPEPASEPRAVGGPIRMSPVTVNWAREGFGRQKGCVCHQEEGDSPCPRHDCAHGLALADCSICSPPASETAEGEPNGPG